MGCVMKSIRRRQCCLAAVAELLVPIPSITAPVLDDDNRRTRPFWYQWPQETQETEGYRRKRPTPKGVKERGPFGVITIVAVLHRTFVLHNQLALIHSSARFTIISQSFLGCAYVDVAKRAQPEVSPVSAQ